MSVRVVLVPSYRRHKQSGQAIVTLPDGLGGRHDVLLGTFASASSRAEYARIIAEWEAADRRVTSLIPPNSDVSVNELIVGFWHHAERHYRRTDGTVTNEISEYRYTLKPLKELYGRSRTTDFGPLALKAVRERMIKSGWCRSVINQRIGRIMRVFKWGVAEELVPASIYQALQAVTGIPRGRGLARETEPVGPVPDAFVEAIRPFVLPPVWAMIQLQRLTGMRPG